MIENYNFGNLKYDGKKYTSDLIIYPDKIKDNWWRKEGHHLYSSDLKDIKKYNPEVLIIGKGYYGVMKVDNSVKEFCKENNIELIAQKTSEAVKRFNDLVGNKKVVFAAHLTC